jgi:hypothetical protein
MYSFWVELLYFVRHKSIELRFVVSLPHITEAVSSETIRLLPQSLYILFQPTIGEHHGSGASSRERRIEARLLSTECVQIVLSLVLGGVIVLSGL